MILINILNNNFKKHNILHYLLISILVFLLILLYVGTLSHSGDTEYSYLEAKNFELKYANWHPPFLSLLWDILNTITFDYNNKNILYYYSVIIFSFSIVFICGYFKKIFGFYFLVIFLLNPFVISMLTQVIKDSILAFHLLAALSIIIWLNRFNKANLVNSIKYKFLVIFYFLFLAFAALSRHNGIFAVLPFIFYYVFYHVKHNNYILKFLNFIILSCTIIVFVTGLNFLITRVDYNPAQQIASFDLVNMSVNVGKPLLPDIYNAHYSKLAPYPWVQKNSHLPVNFTDMNNLKKIYNPYTNLHMYWYVNDNIKGLVFIGDTNKNKEILTYYLHAISQYPLEYLNLRLILFLKTVFDPISLFYETTNASHIKQFFDKSAFYNFFPYYVIIASLIVMTDKTLIYRLIFSSGMIYCASFFFLSTSADGRYFFWGYICCWIIICLKSVDTLQNMIIARLK